jgi:hypothetical protein
MATRLRPLEAICAPRGCEAAHLSVTIYRFKIVISSQ